MIGCEIKLLITDFDGTLVDTFKANYLAYQKAFQEVGLSLKEDFYKTCFGFRFDEFMKTAGVDSIDVARRIKLLKAEYYPTFFSHLKVNQPLVALLKSFKNSGGKTAIASTARRTNLEKALVYCHCFNLFDLILAGEEVKEGKPAPEIYQTVLSRFSVGPSQALVFEDSLVGIQAAESAGINYITINPSYYGD